MSKRDDVILELSTSPKFGHAVFGAVKESLQGHHIIAVKNANDALVKFAQSEDEFQELFLNDLSDEFKARIAIKGKSAGVLCKLCFVDFSQDERMGSHTDYSVFIPNDEQARLIPIIFDDPTILIDVFRLVFPNQVHGTIVLDPKWVEAYDRWAS